MKPYSIRLILAFALCWFALPSMASRGYWLGDVNGDSVVSIKDLALLVKYLGNPQSVEINTSAADVNRSGTVGIEDIVPLVDIILQKTSTQWVPIYDMGDITPGHDTGSGDVKEEKEDLSTEIP